MRRKVTATLAFIVLLTSCSPEPDFASPQEFPAPPPITLINSENQLALDAWSYCWSDGQDSICSDGAAPDPLPDAGTADEPLRFDFGIAGFSFEATTLDLDGIETGRLSVQDLGDGLYDIDPFDEAGSQIVEIFGRNDDRGDTIVTFVIDVEAS